MYVQHLLLASAALFALAPVALAQSDENQEKILPPVTVTAAPFDADETRQLLTPAKILRGDELRNKLGASLGDTLSRELGVSASSFGAGASRPIIRGMDGPRIKILQNGMSVSDLSALSSDHGVAVEASTAQQIEILRGPAALLYGSGAIGGLVNVVNQRIPKALPTQATGEAELRFGSADNEKSLSLSTDASAGSIALHLDGNLRDADNYDIPGFAVRNDPGSAEGTLPSSFARAHSLGIGASHIADWGHIGASVDVKRDRYGIPTDEQSFIKLSQTRFDLDGLIRNPFAAFSALSFKIGQSDYRHTEYLQDGTATTNFDNDALETRWELTQKRSADWRAKFGIQTEHSKFSAKSADGSEPDTVPVTKSSSVAGFWVEERDFATAVGAIQATAGLRLESLKRRPESDAAPKRAFDLVSWSGGSLWEFTPGHGLGATVSLAQRAPAAEELYSNGPHEATLTFDVGSSALAKEKSRNLELSLQKTEGLLRWKANLFHNRVHDFIYGRAGVQVDDGGTADPSGEFMQRFWSQADATIHGAELEVGYNRGNQGWSWRGFADTSRGKLDGNGNLPLQPTTRLGIDLDFRQGPWHTGMNLMRAQRQKNLATFETTAAPSYMLLDAQLSYTQTHGAMQLTWFAMLKNALDEEIRLSTSLLKDVAPQAGRSLVTGVRMRF